MLSHRLRILISSSSQLITSTPEQSDSTCRNPWCPEAVGTSCEERPSHTKGQRMIIVIEPQETVKQPSQK